MKKLKEKYPEVPQRDFVVSRQEMKNLLDCLRDTQRANTSTQVQTYLYRVMGMLWLIMEKGSDEKLNTIKQGLQRVNIFSNN